MDYVIYCLLLCINCNAIVGTFGSDTPALADIYSETVLDKPPNNTPSKNGKPKSLLKTLLSNRFSDTLGSPFQDQKSEPMSSSHLSLSATTSITTVPNHLIPLKSQFSSLLGHTFDFSYLEEFTDGVPITLSGRPINLASFTVDGTNLKILEELFSYRDLAECFYVAAKLAGIEKRICQANGIEVTSLALETLFDPRLDVALLPADVDKMERELQERPSLYHLTGVGGDTRRRVKRKMDANTAATKPWPVEQVPYMIVSELQSNDNARTAIEGGIRNWEAETCIRFQVTAQTSLRPIVFRNRRQGCWSYIGRRTSGEQTISLDTACYNPKTVAHEIGHALGFQHEHQRPDRDQYIQILTQNIQPGLTNQFVKIQANNIEDMGVSYDYTSAMHYPRTAFSRNGQPTISVLDSSFSGALSNTFGLSFLDAKLANLVYCSDSCAGGLLTPQCTNGGYRDPNDCSRCKCPDGISSCGRVQPPTTSPTTATTPTDGTTATTPTDGTDSTSPTDPTVTVGSMSQWSDWSTCSLTCGGCGKQTRTRTCFIPQCSGPFTDTRNCRSQACPGGSRETWCVKCYRHWGRRRRCFKYRCNNSTAPYCCAGWTVAGDQCQRQ